MDRLVRHPHEWVSCATAGMLKLSKSEYLLVCPYDRNHRVLGNRFSDHLRRCRQNYELKKTETGEIPLKVNCRYNLNHKVYAPELAYHESGCDDKKLLLLEQIYLNNESLLEAICEIGQDGDNESRFEKERVPYGESAKAQKVDDQVTANSKMIKELLSEVKATEASGGSTELSSLTDSLMKMVLTHHSPTVVKSVLWPDPEIRKARGILMLERQQPQRVSQLVDPDAFGHIHRRARCHKRYKLAMLHPKASIPSDNADSDDDWEGELDNCSYGPKYDWLEHQQNLKGMALRYPPGLTRMQRKMFEKYNARRLKFEEGWFVEDYDYDQGKHIREKKED